MQLLIFFLLILILYAESLKLLCIQKQRLIMKTTNIQIETEISKANIQSKKVSNQSSPLND